MKVRIYSIIAAALLSVPAAFAQGDALPFVRIDRNPRTAAMAGAGAASVQDMAWSAFRNAAAIPFFSGSLDAGLNWQRWAPDGLPANHVNFGTGVKISDVFGFSVGGAYQMGEPYDGFRPYDAVVNLGAGYRITEAFSAGVSFRYAASAIAPQMDLSAFAADFMLMYRVQPGLQVAAGIASVGTQVKSDSGAAFSLPASAVVAVSYRNAFAADHAVEGNLDVDVFFSGNVTAALGVEYGFRDMLFVRAGYHYGTEAAVLPSFATVGLGARYAGVRLEFAYLTASEILGNTMTLGLGYSF